MVDVGRLRVIDFGPVSPLRSQTLWHAIARGVSAGGPATLSFMRPNGPYVSLGYHRRFSEVDTATCAARGLPIYRRMVGGGPVYLDSGQLFFQITVPARLVSGAFRTAMRRLLAPAVAAFREAGVAAVLDEDGELVVGDAKVCGHAGGQIGDAVIVVGNLITSFDHGAAAATLRVPDAAIRPELVRLMRRYVSPTPCDPSAFRRAAVAAYASNLGTGSAAGELSDVEARALDELDARFEDPVWIRGEERPLAEPWRVKIKSGVYLFSASNGTDRLTLSIDGSRVLRALAAGNSLNGNAGEVAARLEGLEVAAVAAALEALGPDAGALVPLARGAERGAA